MCVHCTKPLKSKVIFTFDNHKDRGNFFSVSVLL